jgi:hypothetical protein
VAARLDSNVILQRNMFEKITFEKKLGIDSSEKKYLGLKIATVSFLVALSGGLIAFLGLGKIGYWVVVVGVLGGFIGIFLHFLAMFTSLFKG